MSNLPWFAFYPNDWLTDRVSLASLAAQGLWLRLMCYMHRHSDRYGFLELGGKPVPTDQIAAFCGVSKDDYCELLSELKALGVPSFTSNNVLFSRRMVRDARTREKTAARTKRWRDGPRDVLGDASGDARRDGRGDAVEVQIEEKRDVHIKPQHRDGAGDGRGDKRVWVDFDEERKKKNKAVLDSVFESLGTEALVKRHGRNVRKNKSK